MNEKMLKFIKVVPGDTYQAVLGEDIEEGDSLEINDRGQCFKCSEKKAIFTALHPGKKGEAIIVKVVKKSFAIVEKKNG